MKSKAIIELHGIVNRFGRQTVHDGVDLTVIEGEILGLVGGSGSGKSVLLRTILGLNPPTKGKVLFQDQDVYKLSENALRELRKSWGVLYQDGALFSGLSVFDNVALPLREHTNMTESAIEGLCLFKLGIVGLPPDAASKFPSDLSGGMVRRAGLARALALDPPVLFLDEPTDGLDPIAASAFEKLILSLRDILGLTILIVTHDLDVLIGTCDRIAMLLDGKVKAGTLQDMLHSRNAGIREYFGGNRMQRRLGNNPTKES